MRRGRLRRPQKSTFKKKPRQYKVVCSVCGVELMVPVAPPAEKELTCLSCLQVKKEHNRETNPGVRLFETRPERNIRNVE